MALLQKGSLNNKSFSAYYGNSDNSWSNSRIGITISSPDESIQIKPLYPSGEVYIIERSINSGTWHYLGYSTSYTEYIDDTVLLGLTYSYRSKHIKGNEESVYSNISTITIPSQQVPQSIQGSGSATISVTSIALGYILKSATINIDTLYGAISDILSPSLTVENFSLVSPILSIQQVGTSIRLTW